MKNSFILTVFPSCEMWMYLFGPALKYLQLIATDEKPG